MHGETFYRLIMVLPGAADLKVTARVPRLLVVYFSAVGLLAVRMHLLIAYKPAQIVSNDN